MKIIGIDVGKKGGIAINTDGRIISYPYSFNSLADTYEHICATFNEERPNGCITGKPNRLYNIILNHSQFIGVIGLVCEEHGIPLIIESDCTIRASILGKGNGRNKEMVHEKYKGETPDCSDAMMFADYLYLKQN